MQLQTFFDFCSGIGGGRLGAEKSGLKSVGFADTSRLSSLTYGLFFDTLNERNYGNIRKIRCEELPKFDLLLCGFPCQSFSVIGRRDGLNDKRGQLITFISKILNEAKPMCFLLENVRGLVNHNSGQTLNEILSLLDKSGYRVTYKVLDSLDYGVPQSRKRIYFVGFKKSLVKSIKKFKWPEPQPRKILTDYLLFENVISDEEIPYLERYLLNATNKGTYTISDLSKMENTIIDTRMNDLRLFNNRCPTLRSQRDGLLYSKDGVLYQLSGFDALLLQGFDRELIERVRGKVSNRHLLMQAGNAMTVTTITHIINSINTFLEDF